MENKNLTRQDYIEKDMLDLLDRANEEKRVATNLGEVIESKNYSTYRKLIDSLKKLVDTYKRTVTNHDERYINHLIFRLNVEIEELHELKVDSLKRKNDEQYRCLIDVYSKLIEMVESVERIKPQIKGIELHIDQGLKTLGIEQLDKICSEIHNSNITGRHICPECDFEWLLNDSNFFVNRNNGKLITIMCKSCAKKYVLKSEGHLLNFLRKIDYPFIRQDWIKSKNDLGEYFKLINMGRDRGKLFKHSEFI